MTGLQPDGLSHSEISGSRVICTLPELIAAYHVLLRLREPRHPPAALDFFSYVAFLRIYLLVLFDCLKPRGLIICNRFVSVCQRSSLLPLNAERHAMLIQISKYDLSITNSQSSSKVSTNPLLWDADLDLRLDRHAPKRSCSSRTFRYGYLVTT